MKYHFWNKILPRVETYNLTSSEITKIKNVNLTDPPERHNQNDRSNALWDSCNIPKRKSEHYTKAEDNQILKYLTENDKYEEIGKYCKIYCHTTQKKEVR